MEEKERKMLDRLAKRYKKNNEHIKQNYDRVSIALPKGIKPRIIDTGESLNAFIINAVIKSLEEREAAAKAAPGEDQTPPAAAGEAPPQENPGEAPKARSHTEGPAPAENATTGPTEGRRRPRKKPGELDPAEDPAKAAEGPEGSAHSLQEINTAAPATGPESWTTGPGLDPFIYGLSGDIDPAELPFH